MQLDELKTPNLLLNEGILRRNCERMSQRMERAGLALRPHMKTAKSSDVAGYATASQTGAITVSTLDEARYFSQAGIRDILYAVSMIPARAEEVRALQASGTGMLLVADSIEAVAGLAEQALSLGTRFQFLIEIDSGGGRAGLLPDAPELLNVARAIHEAPELELKGVMTHAGHAYEVQGFSRLREVAEQERSALVDAAQRLREAGLPCDIVSAGSTPTAVAAERLDGLTEMRPGVYVFNDLDQLGIGSCQWEDLALSVLCSVIGYNRHTGALLVDAGGLALSKDVSAKRFLDDVGYGWVSGLDGKLLEGLFVETVHQEHGLLRQAGGNLDFTRFPIGTKLRIWPNHACMTAAAYQGYTVHDSEGTVIAQWQRTNGW
ncbi:MAG: alanine racemase [Pseudomonadota bacterium]